MYVGMHVCMWVSMYVYGEHVLYGYACMYMISMYICGYVLCIWVSMYVYRYVCMYVCMYYHNTN